MNRLIAVHNRFPVWSTSLPARISIAALIPYAYYAFVFTLPLQMVNVGIPHIGVSKLFGYALLLCALSNPGLCFRRPPKAFRWFAAYLVVYALLGSYVAFETGLGTEIFTQLLTQLQLLVLFWVSYNLLCSEQVMKCTIVALALSCILLSGLITAGAASGGEANRASVFGENPNALATVLSIGSIALVGLAYGRRINERKLRLLACVAGPLLLISVARTGSRGNMLALIVALLGLVLKPHAVRQNVKAAFMVLIGLTVLAVASYQIEFVRERWERTFETGDVAGREDIFRAAWEMFLQSPVIGWGPVEHLYVLGSQLGIGYRDPHNLYLWILNETGLVGAIFFFGGLWLCWASAWKARQTIEGVVPLVMVLYLLFANLKGTAHLDKFFWLVLAYIVAAGTYDTVIRCSQRYRRPPIHPVINGQQSDSAA